MKKQTLTGLLLVLVMLSTQAQQIYSPENLEQSSQEKLELYLGKAQSLKKTGAILSIAGSASAVTGLILAGAGESTFPLGFGMLLAGTGVTLVGIPILATGASRVKRVNKTIKTRQQGTASIELGPCGIHNYSTGKLQPGLRFSMKF